MDKKIPVYKLMIDDDSETGVEYVALVDRPAIERTWIAFSKEPQRFQVTSSDKRIVSGPLIVADLPIYRKDNNLGEYYAVFDRGTIEKVVQRYFKSQLNSNVNIMHDANQKVDGVYMFESFLIDRDRGIKPPKGFQGLTDGTWFGSYKVENDEVWDEYIKSGELKGFSVEGIFVHEPYIEKPEDVIQSIINVIREIAD